MLARTEKADELATLHFRLATGHEQQTMRKYESASMALFAGVSIFTRIFMRDPENLSRIVWLPPPRFTKNYSDAMLVLARPLNWKQADAEAMVQANKTTIIERGARGSLGYSVHDSG